jgi:hypothetical protein
MSCDISHERRGTPGLDQEREDEREYGIVESD